MPAHFGFLKNPLMKEITLILVIKLALLTVIWNVWFATPPDLTDGTLKTGQHVLGPSFAPVPEVNRR